MRITLRGWLGLSFISFLGILFTYFIGVISSGKDIDKTGARANQVVDENYRAQNWQEPSRFFPLHDKCNAGYDMVPIWVNPTLVILSVLTVAFVCALVASEIKKDKAHRRESQVHDKP